MCVEGGGGDMESSLTVVRIQVLIRDKCLIHTSDVENEILIKNA